MENNRKSVVSARAEVARVFEALRPRLLAYARSFLYHDQDAEDVVQDVCFVGLRRLRNSGLSLVLALTGLGSCESCRHQSLPARPPLPEMTNSLGMTMIRLPGGQFKMGHPEHRTPVHEVRVSGFWIAEAEVTNKQYELIVPGFRRAKESPGDDDPATGITWRQAVEFAEILAAKEGRPYRIPTDAQWEYAARGGLDGKDFPWGDEPSEALANSGVNPGSSMAAKRVKSYPPNDFGLYDMVGNAAEWVSDGQLDFPRGAATPMSVDPVTPVDKGLHIARGGSFLDWYPFTWSAFPEADSSPPEELVDIGIRLAMSAGAVAKTSSQHAERGVSR